MLSCHSPRRLRCEAPSPHHAPPERGSVSRTRALAVVSLAHVAVASDAPTLICGSSAYSGAACDPIACVYLTATPGGVAGLGIRVTITLDVGFTFNGDATTTTLINGANGRVILPTINAPAVGGTGTLGATSGTSVETASVTTLASLAARYLNSRETNPTFESVPNSAAPFGGHSSAPGLPRPPLRGPFRSPLALGTRFAQTVSANVAAVVPRPHLLVHTSTELATYPTSTFSPEWSAADRAGWVGIAIPCWAHEPERPLICRTKSSAARPHLRALPTPRRVGHTRGHGAP